MVRRLGWVAFALTAIALGFACFSIYQNYPLYTPDVPTGQQGDVPEADAAGDAAIVQTFKRCTRKRGDQLRFG